MKKISIRLLSLSLITATLLGLAACGSSAEEDTGVTTETNEDGTEVKTITYTIRHDADNKTVEEDTRVAQLINAFEMLEDDLGGEVNFEFEYLPKLEIDDLVMQVQGGVEADIFLDEETVIGQAVKGGIVQEVDWYKDLPSVSGNIYENVLEVSEYNGHLYGIPIDIAPNIFYANRQMLTDLGWTAEEIESLPERIKTGEYTLDDMMVTAKEAVDAGIAKYGFMMDGVDDCSSYTFANAFGFDIYDEEQNKLIVTDEWIQVFEAWEEMKNLGIIPAALDSFEGTYETMINGETLFFTDVSFYEYSRNNAGKGDEFDAWFNESFVPCLFPTATEGGEGSLAMKVRFYFVSSMLEGEKLEYLKQASEVLAANQELTIPNLEAQAKPSVLKSAEELPEYQDFEFISNMSYMADYAVIRSPHPDFKSKYHRYDRNQVEAILVDGVSPEEAYAKLKEEIEFNIDPEELIIK